jgi:NADH-quinone oxidoreductase subunit B
MSGLDFLTTRLETALGWGRKYSLFHYPFITACCGMEYMSAACAHFDIDRFGAGLTRFSPRQADLLLVVGTVSHKLAIPGCPPRPETVLDGLMKLQDKIQHQKQDWRWAGKP